MDACIDLSTTYACCVWEVVNSIYTHKEMEYISENVKENWFLLRVKLLTVTYDSPDAVLSYS